MGINTILVLDTETTGLKPADGAALLQVGAVSLEFLDPFDDKDKGVWSITGRKLGNFIEFRGTIPPESRAVHHIAPDRVKPGALGCRRREDVVKELLRIEDHDTMMYAAHNAAFDKSFLPELTLPWICTRQVARHIWPEAPNHKNQTLRYWLNVEPPEHIVTGLSPHSAVYDAAVTAAILKVMLEERSPEELLRLTQTPVLLEICNFKKHKGQPWSEVPRDYLNWMVREGIGRDDPDLQYTINYYLGRAA